jgi:DNA (cytosine-5)-methyltransferase 1
MDRGFLRQGFDVRVAVEVDTAAVATLRTNFPKLCIIQRPLEDISTNELLELARLKKGEAACVFGGPPCQSWSIAGNRLGVRDPRGRAVAEFLRVVRETEPLSFCMENVPGLLSHSGLAGLRLIQRELNRSPRTTYEVAAEVLNAAEYGVPQQRKRVFVVGWRGPGEFVFPAATHHLDGPIKRSWQKPAKTVAQAFLGLPKAEKPGKQALSVARSIPMRNKKWYGKR